MATTTRRPRGTYADLAPIHPVNDHQTCLNLFEQIERELVDRGWRKLRLDTYVSDFAPGWTVKHQHARGEWEIRTEQRSSDTRRVFIISRYRALPTIGQALVAILPGLGE